MIRDLYRLFAGWDYSNQRKDDDDDDDDDDVAVGGGGGGLTSAQIHATF